jgi:hypothetical protein
MKNTKAGNVPDAELVSKWLESAGGNISLGNAKLKSYRVSKKGDKITLAIKKKSGLEIDPDKSSS